MDDSITLEVLKDIRNELRTMRETQHADLRETSESLRAELRETREQLTDRLERLERRQTEGELRISTEIVGVTSAIHQVRDLLRDTVRTQLHDHERRITELEKKKA